MVTNGGRIAAKVTDRISTLFSHSPQIEANQIIEFTVIVCYRVRRLISKENAKSSIF